MGEEKDQAADNCQCDGDSKNCQCGPSGPSEHGDDCDCEEEKA
ncbi:hypothetical protein ACFL2D_02260 [Patescibacteria group bacterium]